jgi:hypothetical protein
MAQGALVRVVLKIMVLRASHQRWEDVGTTSNEEATNASMEEQLFWVAILHRYVSTGGDKYHLHFPHDVLQ